MHYEKCGMCTYPRTLRDRIDRIAERANPRRGRGSPNDQARLLTTKIQPPGKQDEKYKFLPRRSASFDPVLHTINQVLAHFRQIDIRVANAHLRVAQPNDDPPIWPPAHSSNQTKLYTFQDIHEIPLTVAVKVMPRTHPLTLEKIHVKAGYNRRWISLSDWIRTLGVRIYPHEGIKAQRIWWAINKKSFPLLKLPAEIRLMVYLHALGGPDIYPVTSIIDYWSQPVDEPAAWQSARILPGVGNNHRVLFEDDDSPWWGYREDLAKEIRVPVWQPNLALFRVNKQVHAEASYAAWELTRKCFINRHMFANVLTAQLGVARQYSWLKRIQLDFTNREYFEFFGVAADQWTREMQLDTSIRQCEVLLPSSMPALRALDIRFRAPDVGYMASPWRRACCQKVMVDWIMTFAFPWIAHIKQVTMSGAVRTVTKEKWNAILGSRRSDHPISFDASAELAKILNTSPEGLPPRCSCNRRYECIVGHIDRGRAFNSPIRTWMATETEFDPHDLPYTEEEAMQKEHFHELQSTGGW